MKERAALLFALILLTARIGIAQQSANAVINWPLEVSGPDGTAIIYQPQPESFNGDQISARVAVSTQPKGANAPIFGAAWIIARIATDRDAGAVTITNVEVPKVRFPNSTPDEEKRFGDLVSSYLTQLQITFPHEVLKASLAVADRKKMNAANLRNDPPRFIFATSPTVLVTLDGEPQMQPVDNSTLMRVVNTPFALFFNRDAKNYLLRAGNNWLSASDLSGTWEVEKNVPAAAQAAIAKEVAETPASSADANEPAIIVSKEPAELIVTDGDMQLTPLPDNELLYVSNTDSDVFLEVESGNYFVLSAGRWYNAPSTEGPWTFVPPDKVPATFARIPPGSPKANVLVNVPGTPEADDAVLDASIPQIQEVDPNTKVDLKVTYDGDPKFEDIENTSLQAGVNTASQVIKSGAKYYLCEQAVWYESDSPNGPWQVSSSVPQEVYSIPPSNPNYNVTYVRIYDAKPTVVRIGYLSGYTGSYIYGGTVVFGTGYVYRPWFGTYYYPRPVTWGVRVVYNPSSGTWTYAPAYTNWYAAAFAASSIYWGGVYAGWWGRGGYRWGHPYYRYRYDYRYHGKYPPGYRPPATHLPEWGNRPPASQLPQRGNRPPATTLPTNWRDNIYRRPENPIAGQRPTQLPADRGRLGSGAAQLPADRVRPGGGASQLPADRVRPGGGASQLPANTNRRDAIASKLPADRTRPGQGATQLPANRERPGQGQIATRPAKRPNDVLADRSGNVFRKAGNDWQQRDKSGWTKPAAGQGDFAKSRPQLERDNFSRQRGQQLQQGQGLQRPGAGGRLRRR